MKGKKKLLHAQMCVLPDALNGFRPEVVKYLSEKLPLSQKLKVLPQRESFLTMFYPINSSPIACYKISFYANNYFE